MITDGLNLMLYGMGTVFVFLTLLVFATTAMSSLVNRFAPEPVETEQPAALPNARLVAVIEAAVAAHRAAK